MKFIAGLIAVLGLLIAPAFAAEEKGASGVGYGGAYVQLKPLMVPTRSPTGEINYEPVTIRLVLDAGDRERVACFSVPIVHEKLLIYFNGANLTPADFVGQRRDVLAKKLLEVALASTAKNYYSDVKIIDQSQLQLEAKLSAGVKPKASSSGKPEATPEEQLENKSKTMTNQCQ
ncbi:MAG: hypothetical protein JNK21_14075 [Rhodospirillaceae bacterium]|nr:hypothetical protein [Rhodospirillaceae bacterium]